jgi:hypothetical protein
MRGAGLLQPSRDRGCKLARILLSRTHAVISAGIYRQIAKRIELIGKCLQEYEMSDAAVEVVERIGPPRNLTFELHDWAVLAKCRYPVARSDQLGDKPIQAQFLDVDLVIYRAGEGSRSSSK